MHADRLLKKRKNQQHESLHPRALINLPIPLPSIPLLSPIIGGNSPSDPNPPLISLPAPSPTKNTQGQSSPTTSPPQQPPPQQTPAQPPPPQQPPPQQPPASPSPPSGGDNGNGSNPSPPSGGSSSGGGSGNDGGSSGSDESGSGQGGSGSGNGNAQPPAAGQSAPPSGGNGEPGSSPVYVPPVPVSMPLSAIPSGASVVSIFSGTITVSGVPLATQYAIVNVGGGPPTGGGGGGGGGNPTASDWAPGASGTGVSGGTHGSSGNSGGNGSSSGGSGSESSGTGSGGGGGGTGTDGSQPGSGAASAGHHGLSSGLIAVLAILAAIILIVLLFFACRRRSLRKRLVLRQKWFRSKEPVSPYGATGITSSGFFKNKPPSVRSSFGTTYEHDPFHAPSPPPAMPLGTDWPLYLPTAEMTQATPSPITIPPIATTTATDPSPTIRSANRSSSDSLISFGSVGDALHSAVGQVLLVPERAVEPGTPISPEATTPLSVRPFSPTERWSFPMPPPSSKTVTPRASSTTGLNVPRTSAASPESYATSDFHSARDVGEDPFADTSAVHGIESTEDAHTTETYATADTETGQSFSRIEVVRRPFVPTLQDEIAAQPGDQMRMLKKFDDGWGYADNVTRGTRGLFPIDCLREADQELPAFLAAKRLSSYSGLMPQPPSPATTQ